VDGTGSGSYPMVGFGISDVERSVYATKTDSCYPSFLGSTAQLRPWPPPQNPIVVIIFTITAVHFYIPKLKS
jgi:hypothetical protein